MLLVWFFESNLVCTSQRPVKNYIRLQLLLSFTPPFWNYHRILPTLNRNIETTHNIALATQLVSLIILVSI